MKARLFVLPLLIAATLSAQGPHGGGFGRNSSGTPPTPAEMVTREVQMLTRFLSLDAGQQATATTALTNAQTQLAVNAATLQADRLQLVAAVKANQVSGIPTLTATIANLQGQQDAIRATAAATIYASLTPAQQMKLGNGLGPLMGGGGWGRGPRF
jgi:Spy/CpxP family protein refolding chaperone